jgi:Protein of unknown function (DUF2752)
VVDRARYRRSVIVLGLAGIFGLITVSGLPICPMAGVLGIPCPGCGLTRATLALARADFSQAFSFHPLVFVLAPLFIVAVSNAAWDYVRGPSARHATTPWLASRMATAVAWVLLAATLSVWGARFLGYFGGPVPVLTLREWARGAPSPVFDVLRVRR